MNFRVFTMISRVVAGEPLEKSTKADVQLWGSGFASIPVFIVAAMIALGTLKDAPVWAIWAALTGLTVGYFFVWLGLLRRLPIWALGLAAAITWPSFAFVSWTR